MEITDYDRDMRDHVVGIIYMNNVLRSFDGVRKCIAFMLHTVSLLEPPINYEYVRQLTFTVQTVGEVSGDNIIILELALDFSILLRIENKYHEVDMILHEASSMTFELIKRRSKSVGNLFSNFPQVGALVTFDYIIGIVGNGLSVYTPHVIFCQSRDIEKYLSIGDQFINDDDGEALPLCRQLVQTLYEEDLLYAQENQGEFMFDGFGGTIPSKNDLQHFLRTMQSISRGIVYDDDLRYESSIADVDESNGLNLLYRDKVKLFHEPIQRAILGISYLTNIKCHSKHELKFRYFSNDPLLPHVEVSIQNMKPDHKIVVTIYTNQRIIRATTDHITGNEFQVQGQIFTFEKLMALVEAELSAFRSYTMVCDPTMFMQELYTNSNYRSLAREEIQFDLQVFGGRGRIRIPNDEDIFQEIMSRIHVVAQPVFHNKQQYNIITEHLQSFQDVQESGEFQSLCDAIIQYKKEHFDLRTFQI